MPGNLSNLRDWNLNCSIVEGGSGLPLAVGAVTAVYDERSAEYLVSDFATGAAAFEGIGGGVYHYSGSDCNEKLQLEE